MKIVLSLTLFWFQVFINSKAELNSNQDDPDPDYLSSPFNKGKVTKNLFLKLL